MALALSWARPSALTNRSITTAGSTSLIATLGTMGIYRGITTWLAQGGAITLRYRRLHYLYRPAISARCWGSGAIDSSSSSPAAVGDFVLAQNTLVAACSGSVGSNEEWRAIPDPRSNACAR